jgi:hypothetical protein
MATRHPARAIQWRTVTSSNVAAVGWDRATGMYVEYLNGAVYRYAGVSRQRAVACAFARSVGEYVNRRVKPVFPSTRIGGAA